MKMDQPKIKNGKLILNISEIGTIIKKMDSVYNFMETEINTKGVGKMIKEMAKELSGYQKEKISKKKITYKKIKNWTEIKYILLNLCIDWEENIQGTGKMIKKLEEVPCFIKMEIDMMVYGNNIKTE